MPPLGADPGFLDEPILVFGLLLAAGALVAGLARRSFLSLTALFVVAGFSLGRGGLEVLDIDPSSDFIQGLAASLVALLTHTLTDLGWTESFLLGALLSPTDPVLSSTVVTNPRVPRMIRHSLNLESGLNDGLALRAVIAFTAAASSATASSGGSSPCRTSAWAWRPAGWWRSPPPG